MFFGKGLRIGRISSINICLDYSWFIIFGLFIYLLSKSYFPVLVPGAAEHWYWIVATFTSLLFFASVLTHEISHAVVARRHGIPINSITLFIFGGVAQMEDEPGTPNDEFKMAIAGPLASVGIAIIFFLLSIVVARLGLTLVYASFTYLWFINAMLAVFNIIPAYPLDGGRVFRSILWRATGSLRRSTFIASIAGQSFGWLLISFGAFSLFFLNGGAFNGIWFGLIGWFVITAARGSYQQVLVKDTLRNVPIGEVMNTQVEAVPSDITVDRLVREYFLRESASTLPVEGNNKLLGMVSVEDVRALPRDSWSTTIVAEITKPMAEDQVLHPGADAWDAANTMSHTNQDRVIVTEDNHVEGVVTRGAIARWLQIHSSLATGNA